MSPVAILRWSSPGVAGLILAEVAIARRPVAGTMGRLILTPAPTRVLLACARKLASSRKRALE
ncbi:MAG TPA: hypothetical protein VG325_08285 [Solirubrobacteraceae bacterium]|nr:hypothetical protein [Solirubrobacteraceae bacterium]